jgi:hypothetical protein
MSRVRVPTIQHAAGIWDPDPSRIAKKLLHLANKSPPFSYANLYKLAFDLMSRGVPYGQVLAAASGMRLPLARKNYLEILPLLRDYAISAGNVVVNNIVPRPYAIGRDLRILVNPPFMYFRDEAAHLPWFVFWKTNLFDERRLRLFITMLREVFKQDPDIDDASIHLVVCSARPLDGKRALQILDTSEIASFGRSERDEMLGIFAAGYAQAVQAQAEGRGAVRDFEEKRDDTVDQFDLFA